MDLNTPFDFSASSCSREACDVRFMYFSPEELRAISVEEVAEGPAFDDWGETLDGSVFSPAMGPMAKGGPKGRLGPRMCKTCGLEKDCPGHMGRIELAVPVYNPFLFGPLYKLLQQTCLKCLRLKVDPAKSVELIRKLRLIMPGEFSAANSYSEVLVGRKRFLQSDCKDDEPGAKRLLIEKHPHPLAEDQGIERSEELVQPRSLKEHAAAAQKLIEQCEAAAAEMSRIYEAKAKAAPEEATHSSSALDSVRSEIDRFLKEIPGSCPLCRQRTAKWRKEGHSQLFVKRPGDKEEVLVKPGDVRMVLRQIWENDKDILRWLVPGARTLGADVFFMETLAVPPNRFRPPGKSEDGRPGSLGRPTTHLLNIVRQNAALRDVIAPPEKAEAEDPAEAGQPPDGEGRTVGDLEKNIQDLQLMVNAFLDSGKTEKHAKLSVPGIRQEFERKEGIFRMKMMGKRVNFAARSVISPDLNIETSEIGIPQAIAEGLYYPEVAATHNAEVLRGLVERGIKYPGAAEVHVPDTNGGKQVKQLKNLSEQERKALAKQLITDIESGKPPMTVFRQLKNGDPLLVNRQPTLHKPGIMAHTARVLRKEKTIRLHYVNCNTYNADFDGDEMNLHAPQDPIGRMEALHIARADKQYLVPTSGKPLRGLIQDHVIAGTMLCKRDTYYERSDVCWFLYHGLRAAFDNVEMPLDGGAGRPWVLELDESRMSPSQRQGLSPKIRGHTQRIEFVVDPPCIRKPKEMWTGKQVFSMLLKNILTVHGGKGITKDGGMNLKSKSKTPGDIWNGKLDGNSEEATVIFQDTDLLLGVMDKNQFGASMFGITHLLYELAGGHVVSIFLSSIARVFTMLLQRRGFTCAFMDLLLKDDTEKARLKLIVESRKTAKKTVEDWLRELNREEVADGSASCEDISEAARDLMHKNECAEKYEGMVIGKMKESWSDMINKCIPVGQKLTFPRNCFSAMVQTGAKGSKVNQSQITCCLGQQELEGRLPPLMATRKSLPCFAPYDMASRTRGYIADRFLGGIRPQEFFFHCMAGREGLVDTAVKTSRSGYLQRCLVKHLECLTVGYDLSVRDSDGSVVQFLYGEDGADVTRASYLFKFDELRANFHMLRVLGEKHLQRLKGDLRTVDVSSASGYLEVSELLGRGEVKEAHRRLKDLIASCGCSVRVSGLVGKEFEAANGIYAECLAPDPVFPEARFVKDGPRDASGTAPAYILHKSGKWRLIVAAPSPDRPAIAIASRLGDDSSRVALLAGTPDEWKLKKGAQGEVRIADAASLDAHTQAALLAVLVKLKNAQRMAKKVPGYKAELELDPMTSILSPAHCLGSTSELHERKLQEYVQKEVKSGSLAKAEAEAFVEFMRLKFMRCLAEPGEAVGVIAAQSMGEPSTQMTLNTFHLAGHGGANVTLGIPRLREIIQTGSKSCSTPLMRVKVLSDPRGDTSFDARRRFAENMQKKFRRITILDLLARLTVHDSVRFLEGEMVWSYVCRFEFMPLLGIGKKVPHLSEDRINDALRSTIVRRLKMALKKVIMTGKMSNAAIRAKLAGGEEGEAVGVDEKEAEQEDKSRLKAAEKSRKAGAGAEDDDGADGDRKDKKKKRRVMGAEDKAANQEQEVDDDAEGKDDDDVLGGDDDFSGMYSDGEEQEAEEDKDEEGAEGEQEQEDGADEAEENEDNEEDDAAAGETPTKPGKKAGKLGSSPGKKKSSASGSKAPERKKQLTAQELLREVAASGEMVWCSGLEADVATIVVMHRYADCPHSLFIADILKDICQAAEIKDPSCEGIDAVHIKEEQGKNGQQDVYLECEGSNMAGLQALPLGCVDHAKIYTNNILKILQTYGVEAARAAVVREVNAVFGHYGIDVDFRHLYLIADYMAHLGGLRAFNRHGMQHATSPLLQMSFETTMGFLTRACQESIPDKMKSPASAIVLGQVPPVGTGMVSLMVDFKPQVPAWKQKRQFKW